MLMLTDATPGSVTVSVAVPTLPFADVAVIVVVPSATPMAMPVTGSIVAISGAALLQASVVVDFAPLSSTVAATICTVLPTFTIALETRTVSTGPGGVTVPWPGGIWP